MSLAFSGWLQPGNEIPYGAGLSDFTCRLSHCPGPPTVASTALRSRWIGLMQVNASVRESAPSAPTATCHGRQEVSIAPSVAARLVGLPLSCASAARSWAPDESTAV